jgi:hypothetical protein
MLTSVMLLSYYHTVNMVWSIDLEANQEFFIKKGVYLLLEKLKTFVYRNLFRKVYDIYHTHHIISLQLHS